MTKQQNIEFIDFGKTCWKNRRILFMTGCISAILGVIVSFLIPVLYKSSASIYPASISYIESTDAIYQNGNISEFGEIEQAEQMIELFSSNDFHERIIKKLDLYKNYNINPEAPKAKFKMNEIFNDLIRVRRSKFSAIRIDVYDKNPEMAAAIATFILKDLNDFRVSIIRQRIEQNIAVLDKTEDSLQQNVQILLDSLSYYKKLGVVSKNERVGLLRAIDSYKNNDAEMKAIIKANIHLGVKYDDIEIDYYNQTALMQHLRKIRMQWKTSSSKGVAYQFIIENPQVPDKKYSPKHLFVILGIISASLFLMIVYLSLKQNWNIIKNKLEA